MKTQTMGVAISVVAIALQGGAVSPQRVGQPPPIETCVRNWISTRQIPSSTQGGPSTFQMLYRLVTEVLKRAPLPAAEMHGCGYEDALLDKTSADAEQFIQGSMSISLGVARHQFFVDVPFYADGAMLEGYNATEDVSVEGHISGDRFEGTLRIKKESSRVRMSSRLAYAGAFPLDWSGIMERPPKRFAGNAMVAWHVSIASVGLPLYEYVDWLLSAGGAHFGGEDLNRLIQQGYDRTLAGLSRWTQTLWKSAGGIVAIESPPAMRLDIVLDGTAIGHAPFTFPVTANVSHKIVVMNGSVQIVERTISLHDGELVTISVP
jgi:hypothetical protein